MNKEKDTNEDEPVENPLTAFAKRTPNVLSCLARCTFSSKTSGYFNINSPVSLHINAILRDVVKIGSIVLYELDVQPVVIIATAAITTPNVPAR